MSGIEAVLFDLHGVLTSSPWEGLASVGTAAGHTQEEVLAVMLGDYATDDDHPWHRLERGEIGLGEYLPEVLQLAAAAGVELDFERLRGFNERIRVHDDVVETVRRLRAAGLRTGVVTNNIKEASAGWRALLPVDELFDVVVDSSAVGVRKPDPAIFAVALDRLGGIAPEAAVFLDDAPGNVEGARRAGLHAIHVEDVAIALAELDTLLASAPA
ncbi:MAG TPA: HAD family phosphatase [Acidimicrobiales bacterium]|nr:HAD family phosphatase [Acidimicrobiales bacterium]